MVKMCRHCKTKQTNRPRQLCWTCYYDPAIKALYVAKPIGSNKHRIEACNDDPTEEELDKMIAEQRPTMPKFTPKGRRVKAKHWTPPVFKVGFKGNRRINGVTYQLGT